MHAVRETLLDAQADAAGVPLLKVPVPWPCSNAQYEQAVGNAVASAKGVSGIAFGDLFLEDIRRYREGQMKSLELEPLFPLWGRPTKELAREMIASGLRAVVTCVDRSQLPARFAAAQFDSAFLDALPAAADPCGERGEFHTFVWAGPMLRAPLPVRAGEVVERDGFAFADLLPA
jgi:diphthamide synthase (EF-2-diphthine--ammonia ligase)